MAKYIQHKSANLIHIVRDTWPSGEIGTYCNKWYWPTTTFTPDLSGEREENVVCSECRQIASKAVGKRVYSRPTLRRVSEAKRKKLRREIRDIKLHEERQRLAAWNRAAQKETT